MLGKVADQAPAFKRFPYRPIRHDPEHGSQLGPKPTLAALKIQIFEDRHAMIRTAHAQTATPT